jgi:hypothetical protein
LVAHPCLHQSQNCRRQKEDDRDHRDEQLGP